jgi:hypothetical protein
MPLGVSLLIGGLVIGRTKFHKIALAFVISVSLSYTSMNYLAFSKDWDKQTGIIQGIRNSSLIEGCSVILITDRTDIKNAVGRYYRFYEWNAMFKISTGTQDRFVISLEELELFDKGNFDSFYTREYSAANFKRSEKNVICSVDIYYHNDFYTLNVKREM